MGAIETNGLCFTFAKKVLNVILCYPSAVKLKPITWKKQVVTDIDSKYRIVELYIDIFCTLSGI